MSTHDNYRHKDEWMREGRDFLVTVTRHSVQTLYDHEGTHRWCVYAYVYPKHPHFARFDGTETMWQDAATALPLHRGPSLCRKHMSAEGEVTSYQVGADYNHLHDDYFTHYATPDDAREVFSDADRLFAWLDKEGGAQ